MSSNLTEQHRAVFRRMVQRMVVVSLLPVVAIGAASFVMFYRFNRAVVIEQQTSFLRYHRESITAFLGRVSSELGNIAYQYSRQELLSSDLRRVFTVITERQGVYTDIGVIDAQGDHLLYLGPYDLAGRNYRKAPWFDKVVERGVYISDMFLGFRGTPHFIVAVKRMEGDTFWILRATVDTDYFSRLVDAVRAGRTGEAFIVNPVGVLQTPMRSGGEILSPSGFPSLSPHDGLRSDEYEQNGKRYLYATTWLEAPRWLLVFRQETADVYAALRHASALGLGFFAVTAVFTVLLARTVARRQVRLLSVVDAEKEKLHQELLVTGRTAAVGELSAGIAHEINNPLATIYTLATWIADLADQQPIADEDRVEILAATRKIGEQVERCKAITQGLLKFSRRVGSSLESLDVNDLLCELATMARARARVEGSKLDTDLALVPRIFASPVHVQQVFVNLVNNALDAVADRREAQVLIRSRAVGPQVVVEVVDNGCGIADENLQRIFTPFFTTKPVGRGTGLGLAICYGLVQKLGGSIRVTSTLGEGTTFTVALPALTDGATKGAALG
jgi:two-component system NtrC family sensor kinase